MFTTINYVTVLVTNMEQSIKFYRDKLNIPLHFSSEYWTEFDMGETTLALHEGEIKKSEDLIYKFTLRNRNLHRVRH